MEKVTPFPSTPGETPTPIDSKNESTQLEDSKNKEKIKINMEIRAEKIIIKIKYGIDIYNCINSLNELKEKDNYFKSFEKKKFLIKYINVSMIIIIQFKKK